MAKRGKFAIIKALREVKAEQGCNYSCLICIETKDFPKSACKTIAAVGAK